MEALRREVAEELKIIVRDVDPNSFAYDPQLVLLLLVCTV